MSSSLPVVECFHSVQGEGAHCGRSAFFIRLALCKVGCAWCDTKESWSSKNHPQIPLSQLSDQVANASLKGAAFLVLTGGEPLHHNLKLLCKEIRQKTIVNNGPMPIHIETSGVNELSGDPDWITLSPKPHAPPRADLLAACHELKVVIHEPQDLIFAEEMAKKAIKAKKNLTSPEIYKVNIQEKPLLFLQPGWKNKEGESLALEHVKCNSQWRLSLQTHKWLGVQ